MSKRLCSTWVMMLALFLSACASLEKVGQVLEGRKPTAQVVGLKLTGLDFEGVNLAFDVKVDNPNPVGVSLAGFDYDLKLLGSPFLRGEQPMGMKLAAKGSSRVEVPVRLGFQSLMDQYRQLSKAEKADYQIDLGMAFEVPVLGRVRVPVDYRGEFPIPRMPEVKLRSLDVQQLSVSGAKLLLQLEVENPNAFSLALDKLDYHLKLNGLEAGGGLLQKSLDIGQGGQGVIGLPLSLDFAQVGAGLYKALLSGSIRYELSGSMDAASLNPLLETFRVPLDKQGSVKLR